MATGSGPGSTPRGPRRAASPRPGARGSTPAGAPRPGVPKAATPKAATPRAATPRAGASRPGAPRAGTPRAPAARGGTSAPRTGGRTGASRPASASASTTASAGRAGWGRGGAERRSTRPVRRLLVLASVVVLLAITLVPTLRSYLRQQGDIAALRDQVTQQRASVEELQQEQARWKDDAYVVQQARERLKFVKPGDRSYTLLDAVPQQSATPGVAAAPASSQDHPWYGQLWESAVIADDPKAANAGTAPAAPAPPAK